VVRHRVTPTHPPRQPQAERAERMRSRLLDATIDCLAACGYGQMSTNDIVRRARVSRGALAHHYPTKADLVRAAAVRLLEQRAREFRERFSAIDPDQRTLAAALDVLWSFYSDPSGVALVELTVAARSHAELQGVLGPMQQQIEASTAEVFAEFFPDLARLPYVESALRSVYALFAGLVVSSAGDHAHVDEVREFLKTIVALSEQLIPMLPAATLTPRSLS
jgi:AcrR family transcriptional regulator